jgi:2-polyprenyl-6-methoxyphenol hydroxylase-like FAD-dependent oxidoreductase
MDPFVSGTDPGVGDDRRAGCEPFDRRGRIPGQQRYASLEEGVRMATQGAKIIVLGAGICGLAAGMVLRRDGHEVTILERDPEPAPRSPREAWDRWMRGGVIQFRQPHYLQSRGRIVLEEELPDVLAALEAAGGLRFDLLSLMPPPISDRAPRAGDERFPTVTARRPVLEQVLGRAADAEHGLEIHRGVSVRELAVRAYDGLPHVTGVRTDSGKHLSADLVVDATGRRSQLPRWLEAAGARPVYEEVEDSGFMYYTRYFRSRNGALPEFRAPILTPVGTFSVLTLPSDNETWSVTIYASAGDRPLKRLRDPDLWSALVAACPRHAQWLDGKPITGVLPMSGINDRYRRFMIGGRPVATGIAAVGDAYACTNPSNGRGMSLGLMHVQRLRDVTRAHLHAPRQFAEVWDEVTEAELTPWYRENVQEDRARAGEMEALCNGLEPEPPSTTSAVLQRALLAAVPRDADAFRAFVASRCCLTRLEETFASPGFAEHILALASNSDGPPPADLSRSQLLELLHGARMAA